MNIINSIRFLGMAVLLSFGHAAYAGNEFAAGSAQISESCKLQFDARSNGGHVSEQCDFGNGKVLFTGPVLCFKAEGNKATFVWQFQNAPYREGYYQQVYIVDNGPPGHGMPDEFSNDSETSSQINCGSISVSHSSSPVLKGNFVVSSDEEE